MFVQAAYCEECGGARPCSCDRQDGAADAYERELEDFEEAEPE